MLLLGGGVVGLAALAVHGRWWGLLLGLTGTAAAFWALPDRWWGRLPYALGWAAVVLVAAAGRPEGDFVVAGDFGGYAMLVTVIILTVGGLATLRPTSPRRGEDSDGGAHGF